MVALANEQLHVADDLNPGGTSQIDGPVRLRMGQRDARRKHESRKLRPVGLPQVARGNARALCTGNAVGIVVPGNDLCASAKNGLGSRDARPAQSEKGDRLVLEGGDRDHGTLPELEGGKADHRENDRDDPEADHDLALGPALLSK